MWTRPEFSAPTWTALLIVGIWRTGSRTCSVEALLLFLTCASFGKRTLSLHPQALRHICATSTAQSCATAQSSANSKPHATCAFTHIPRRAICVNADLGAGGREFESPHPDHKWRGKAGRVRMASLFRFEWRIAHSSRVTSRVVLWN
jgi:hypothetical protein